MALFTKASLDGLSRRMAFAKRHEASAKDHVTFRRKGCVAVRYGHVAFLSRSWPLPFAYCASRPNLTKNYHSSGDCTRVFDRTNCGIKTSKGVRTTSGPSTSVARRF